MRNQLDREHGESGDIYDRVVVRLNEKWRVVECRAGIQWILQRRKSASDGGGWSSRSFCRTSEALRRVAAEHAGAIDPEAQEALDRLPEWIEDVDQPVRRELVDETGQLQLRHHPNTGTGLAVEDKLLDAVFKAASTRIAPRPVIAAAGDQPHLIVVALEADNRHACAAALASEHEDDVSRFRVQHAGDELRLFPTIACRADRSALAFLAAIAIELAPALTDESRRDRSGNGYGEVVQPHERLWVHPA